MFLGTIKRDSEIEIIAITQNWRLALFDYLI